MMSTGLSFAPLSSFTSVYCVAFGQCFFKTDLGRLSISHCHRVSMPAASAPRSNPPTPENREPCVRVMPVMGAPRCGLRAGGVVSPSRRTDVAMRLLHEIAFVAIAVLSMMPANVRLVKSLRAQNGKAGRWVAVWLLQVWVIYRLIEYFQLDASGSWDRFNLF